MPHMAMHSTCSLGLNFETDLCGVKAAANQ